MAMVFRLSLVQSRDCQVLTTLAAFRDNVYLLFRTMKIAGKNLW